MEILEQAITKAGGVRALARELGISPQAVSNMRTDGSRPVSPDVAAACAEFLGVSPVPATLEALICQPAARVMQAQRWRMRLQQWIETNPQEAAAYARYATGTGVRWMGKAAAVMLALLVLGALDLSGAKAYAARIAGNSLNLHHNIQCVQRRWRKLLKSLRSATDGTDVQYYMSCTSPGGR